MDTSGKQSKSLKSYLKGEFRLQDFLSEEIVVVLNKLRSKNVKRKNYTERKVVSAKRG